jgi:hypothetical protein
MHCTSNSCTACYSITYGEDTPPFAAKIAVCACTSTFDRASTVPNLSVQKTLEFPPDIISLNNPHMFRDYLDDFLYAIKKGINGSEN